MDQLFFPWSASVTLQIDGFNLDLRRHRELKAFVVVRICTHLVSSAIYRRSMWIQSLPVIAVNYDELRLAAGNRRIVSS